MQGLAEELVTLVDQHTPSLRVINATDMSFKPNPAKWSKKEIIGHMIDSAQSNIRRFIVAQYEEAPHIVYNQDKWVAIVNYQEWENEELIDLWALLNKQVSRILQNTPAAAWQRNCQTEALHTIEWLAVDYIKHLRHHLHQVLNLEPVPYP